MELCTQQGGQQSSVPGSDDCKSGGTSGWPARPSASSNGTSGWGAPMTSSVSSSASSWGNLPDNNPPPPPASSNNSSWGTSAGTRATPSSTTTPSSQHYNSIGISPVSGVGTDVVQQQQQHSSPPSQGVIHLVDPPSLQQQQQQQSSSWAQAAGKSLGGAGNPTSPPQVPPLVSNPPLPTPSAKALELLSTMREALFAQDGWGGQNVNQDSGWDVPGSPELKDAHPNGANWKVNNGTELWDVNVRGAGATPASGGLVSTQGAGGSAGGGVKTPWGHTPASNHGGTWGVDDDDCGGSEGANVWSSSENSSRQQQPAPQDLPPMLQQQQLHQRQPLPPPQQQPWQQQQQPPVLLQQQQPLPQQQLWNQQPPPPQQLPQQQPNLKQKDEWNSNSQQQSWQGQGSGSGSGGSGGGRSNGNEQWKQGGQGGGGGWGALSGPPQVQQHKQESKGWDDMSSPPTVRRVTALPNYDDGTSLWGAPVPGGGGGQRSHNNLPPQSMSQQRTMPNNKMEQSMWGGGPQQHQQSQNRNGVGGGWQGGDVGGGPMGGGGGFDGWPVDLSDNKPPWLGNNQDLLQQQWAKPKSSSTSWGTTEDSAVDTSQWGVKKDDDLIRGAASLHLNDAIDNLDHSSWNGPSHNQSRPDQQQHYGDNNYRNYYSQPGSRESNNMPPLHPGMNPIQIQKALGLNNYQNAPRPSGGGGGPLLPPLNAPLGGGGLLNAPGGGGGGSSVPSSSQLKLLVQQIQMAVQAGYLNSQILQHPLPQQSLYLLNQLLQQIKLFQQLSQAQHQIGKTGNSAAALQLSVQITKAKQQINNLHNQISAQQALHAKEQQQQHQNQRLAAAAAVAGGGGGPPDYRNLPPGPPAPSRGDLRNDQDPFNQDFLKPEPGGTSRLTQWTKLQQLDQQQDDLAHSRKANNDGWSTGVVGGGQQQGQVGGWPSSVDVDDGSSFGDLVPEFEPGKPWKGNHLKSVEDDPTLTPGSVRSPLSLSTIKDASDNYKSSSSNSSAHPSATGDSATPLSLSSNTWSFTPAPAQPNSGQKSGVGMGLGGGGSGVPKWDDKSSWDYNRPPPGMQQQIGGQQPKWQQGGNPHQQNQQRSWGSNPGPLNSHYWLLLRNLTPQIDGSTLKTLCVQHGPLNRFHLYLNHGLALVKYSNRDEAPKAQNALNNCVLGNTTILAETASETDVFTLIQGLGGVAGQSTGNNSGYKESWNSGSVGGRDSSPGLWNNSPWGSSTAGGGDGPDRSTPLSLLPGDLLGGESG